MPMAGGVTTVPRSIHPRRIIPAAGPIIPTAATTHHHAATMRRLRGITSRRRATTTNLGSTNRPRVITSLHHETIIARTRVGTTMVAVAGTTATAVGGAMTTGAVAAMAIGVGGAIMTDGVGIGNCL